MRYYRNELVIVEMTQKISDEFRSQNRECLSYHCLPFFPLLFSVLLPMDHLSWCRNSPWPGTLRSISLSSLVSHVSESRTSCPVLGGSAFKKCEKSSDKSQ
jgi:hypothetical protein